MIERKFVAEKVKEFTIKTFIDKTLNKAGQSGVKLRKTPLGEKIIIAASRPGLIVGRKGENIKLLTSSLKKEFKLENPQIEIEEIANPNLDPAIIAERIATTLERFGSGRFKHIGHKVLEDVMRAGALGAEVTVSGKIPSARARTWRFYQGYLKKSGYISQEKVLKAYMTAELKTGTVGIQVRIMPGDVELPDYIEVLPKKQIETTVTPALPEEEAAEEGAEVVEEAKKAPKKKAAKKATKKAAPKKTESPKSQAKEAEPVESKEE